MRSLAKAPTWMVKPMVWIRGRGKYALLPTVPDGSVDGVVLVKVEQPQTHVRRATSNRRLKCACRSVDDPCMYLVYPASADCSIDNLG
ncbi:hypothetical protein DESC_730015 [Desulfosarcina cetonica]|nr:hypothetical protein DESC_730015 [Desulfosarcina cetonica]